MRRSTSARPTLSLRRLLDMQPPGLRKDCRFAELEAMLRASPRLRAARLNRTAYALLDGPRLRLADLPNFVDTYRVPASPFFELFLTLKWERSSRLAAARRDRERRIAAIAASYPREVLGLLGYLEEAERRIRPDAPLRRLGPWPRSMARARELGTLGLAEWIPLLADYAETLRAGYRSIALCDTETLLACMALECLPDPATGRLPSKAAIRTQYRRLSKACHPDLGGDPRRFLLVSRARDRLLGEGGS
jgi:hypothetical protein